jgi:hypothetical protein
MNSDPLAALTSLEGVGSAFAATRDGIDAVLRDRGLRATAASDTVESLLRGARASGALETAEGSANAALLAEAALRVSTELLSLAPLVSRSPLQAMARVHALAGVGSVDSEDLGRPVDAAAAERLGAIAGLLASPTSAPALVVAAVVHAELISAAAFASHNGIVARAMERLVLVSRGVDEKSLIVPEAGHLALRAAYASNLIGYQSGGTAGVHAWLLYAAQAYAAGVEASPLVSPAP